MKGAAHASAVIARLREALERGDVAQKDVATAINVSPNTIYRWLKGQASPREDSVTEILEFLHRDTDQFKAVFATEIQSLHASVLPPDPQAIQRATEAAMVSCQAVSLVYGTQQQVTHSGSITLIIVFDVSVCADFARSFHRSLKDHHHIARSGVSVGPVRRSSIHGGTIIYGEGTADALAIKNEADYGDIFVDDRYRFYSMDSGMVEVEQMPSAPDFGWPTPVPKYGRLLSGAAITKQISRESPKPTDKSREIGSVTVRARHVAHVDIEQRCASKTWTFEVENHGDAPFAMISGVSLPAINVIKEQGVRVVGEETDLRTGAKSEIGPLMVAFDPSFPIINIKLDPGLEVRPGHVQTYTLGYDVEKYLLGAPTHMPALVHRSRHYRLPLKSSGGMHQQVSSEYHFPLQQLGGRKVHCTHEGREIKIQGDYLVLTTSDDGASDRTYSTFDIIIR